MGIISKTLDALEIQYTIQNGEYTFYNDEIATTISITKYEEVCVDPINFGKIPHIMEDGKVCVFSGQNALISSIANFELEQIIQTYIPYLFGLNGEQKAGEFLMELEYYIPYLVGSKCSVQRGVIKDYKTIEVSNPQNLWEVLNELNNEWYRINPINLPNEYVYIKRDSTQFYLNYDESYKSRLRVAGTDVSLFSGKTVFIGMGSVNSYVLKEMVSKGLYDIIIIDDEKIETGNLFRHAFPYCSMYKVDAAERFINHVNPDVKIKKIYKRIEYAKTGKSQNYIGLADRIVVSVDNYLSWIYIYNYIMEYVKLNCEIIFIGIDTYGNFGKFIKINFNGEESLDQQAFTRFLIEVPKEFPSRSRMVGNGCGDSIAIYNEQNILALVTHMLLETCYGEVKYVQFDN